MANLRSSMNLEAPALGLATDAKNFVFVLENVPLHLSSDEIQLVLTKRFETDVKIYRAFNKTHIFFTVFGKNTEETLH